MSLSAPLGWKAPLINLVLLIFLNIILSPPDGNVMAIDGAQFSISSSQLPFSRRSSSSSRPLPSAISLSSFAKATTLTESSHFDDTIPAAPVQSQAKSCTLDLNNQLLGGVRTACMVGALDQRRCCPVLAAWLMAARSKASLQPSPFPQEPGMPLLPDDSLICVASMKAALESRGIYLAAPNSTCDVVTCFCGIKLNEITIQSCPLTFTSDRGNSSTSSQPVSALMERKSAPSTVVPAMKPIEGQPVLSSVNSSSSPSATPNVSSLPTTRSQPVSLLQGLALNCTEHSYRGCTRCLRTLRKEALTSPLARSLGVSNSSVKSMDCELIGLMWLLETNKTFYIPTVSAVLRALLYSDHPARAPRCSPDTANMPLALDYEEILKTSEANHPHHVVNFSLVRCIPICCLILLSILLFDSC